ncbi:MAG TPA: hypothetical protein DCM59_04165, partial [Clostridium sp.]|nr:hypothetical protein [Clostridium sp.]
MENDSIAKVMFVTTEQDPRYNAHMNALNSIISIGNDTYPGLIRERSIFTYPSGI